MKTVRLERRFPNSTQSHPTSMCGESNRYSSKSRSSPPRRSGRQARRRDSPARLRPQESRRTMTARPAPGWVMASVTGQWKVTSNHLRRQGRTLRLPIRQRDVVNALEPPHLLISMLPRIFQDQRNGALGESHSNAHVRLSPRRTKDTSDTPWCVLVDRTSPT
jgi:hypothetical protein